METNEKNLPLLPLKNTILFPELLLPLAVGRPASRAAVEAALITEEKEIFLVAQRDAATDTPVQEDLYTVGVRAVIRKVNRRGEGLYDVLVQGVQRGQILSIEEQHDSYSRALVKSIEEPTDTGAELEGLDRAVREVALKVLGLAQPQNSNELQALIGGTEDPLALAYLLASLLNLDVAKQQQLLEADTKLDALKLIHDHLSHELQVQEIRSKINTEARNEMGKEQREYFLRQQMRAIQQELGEKNPEQAEAEQLREKLAKADLPDDVRKEAERELTRLEKVPAASPESNVLRTWLEFVIELPWRVRSEDKLDIQNARTVLDQDHYNLKDVKERILEHLAVLKLNPTAKAPILCFVGPPGTGKTSLGASIARALGRKFERMSLGGLHDEAELRGHRRTYIGALPGRLMQAIRRAGANNPVLMLDEIDKLGRDFRGDPAAALLEVLDPEQNNTFRDNYLDLPFDLSKTFFITTANTLDTIPQPLLDRMEILSLAGYSEEEKVEIAKRYLIPRQLKESGLNSVQCNIADETLKKIISGYTREAGLRRLERAIGKVTRKVALRFAENNEQPVNVSIDDLTEMLGAEPFVLERMRRNLPPGVATGLAWTPTGGDVLYIEATLLPEGKGDLTLTGQLGEVMQESARAARSYLWSHAADYGLKPDLFKNSGLHLHVPAGAIPKDGPSAGITAAVALASLYSGRAARGDTAMTGEITLTGLVLPIGGLKEKVLAARRAGIKRVIIPAYNQKDLRDIPDHVRAELEFIPVEHISEVFDAAIPGLTAVSGSTPLPQVA